MILSQDVHRFFGTLKAVNQWCCTFDIMTCIQVMDDPSKVIVDLSKVSFWLSKFVEMGRSLMLTGDEIGVLGDGLLTLSAPNFSALKFGRCVMKARLSWHSQSSSM